MIFFKIHSLHFNLLDLNSFSVVTSAGWRQVVLMWRSFYNLIQFRFRIVKKRSLLLPNLHATEAKCDNVITQISISMQETKK